jgi:hypothetical protein
LQNQDIWGTIGSKAATRRRTKNVTGGLRLVKNLSIILVAAVLSGGIIFACPAGAAHDEDSASGLYTKRGTSGVLAIDNLHENGSTCLTCTNGIYGTSGTRNMRSNEY